MRSPARAGRSGDNQPVKSARRLSPGRLASVVAVVATLGVGLTVLTGGGGSAALNSDRPPASTTAAATSSAATSTAATSTYPGWSPTTPDPHSTPTTAVPAGLRPVSVRIDAIDVRSDLLPLAVDDSGVLVPPDPYDVAGWFTGGPVPGEVGPAILAGHVDSRAGPGVFFRLEEMKPGDRVEVTRSDHTVVSFQVTRVERYPKTDFPTARVYGPTPGHELRLITCGGDFDRSRRSYLDNIVVYAVLRDGTT